MDATAEAQATSNRDPVLQLARETSRLHRNRVQRLRSLSVVEIVLYVVGTGWVWYYAWREFDRVIDSRRYPAGIYDAFSALASPVVLIALGVVVVGIFSLMLNGVTPIVSLLSRLHNPDQVDPSLIEELLRQPRTMEAPIVQPDYRPEPADKVVDQIERDFSNYILRSQRSKDAAQRRPNALLFVGTVIAVAGLVFFVLTLPGGRFAFLDGSSATSADPKADFWATTVQLLPRLLMLIFIQVLAGFFLRQYRSSIEDFRYYESVLRHREAQYLSYNLRKKLDDKKALLRFADELLKEQEFGRLMRGQSTIALEAQRAEANEFSSLYERLAALVTRSERSEAKAKKTRHDTPSSSHAGTD